MAIGSVAPKKNRVTPANKVGSRSQSEEVKFTERPASQQKSSIQREQEQEDNLIREVVDTVHREENLEHRHKLSRITNTNKNFKSVLQVHRVSVESINGALREIYIPQSKLKFADDDEYYNWAMKGGFDKDLNPEHDYVVLRKILSNK